MCSLTKTISGGNDEHCTDCGQELETGESIFEDAYENKYCDSCGEQITFREIEEAEKEQEPWD